MFALGPMMSNGWRVEGGSDGCLGEIFGFNVEFMFWNRRWSNWRNFDENLKLRMMRICSIC